MSGFTNWELLDDGSFNGVRKWIRSSDDDHGTVEVKHEDVGSHLLLESNKSAQNESFDKRSEMWHVARIPAYVQLEWLTKYGVDPWDPNHAEGRRRLLNSSEYAHLKRAPIVI